MSSSSARASWLELDTAALAHNVSVFREVAGPEVSFGAVLKGNAYGHGLRELLPAVHPLADLLYVIDPGDALAIRAFEKEAGAPRRRVLVLGALDADEAIALARNDVEATVTDGGWHAFVEPLRAAGLRLEVHLHVDSGLGREGFRVEDLDGAASLLASDVFSLKGVMSHFANTEDVNEQTYAMSQLDALGHAVEVLQRHFPGRRIERHVAASAASLVIPRARMDAVRVGIALYGLWPSNETRLSARVVLGAAPELRPVLSWRCRSQAVKWLPAGSYVGYGCTYRCPVDTRIAVLPVGYFDGYPRLLSGRAHVLVNGRRCAVLGRVMMNHLIVDVTQAAPDADEVVATLLGRDGDEQVSANLLASWAQTINYEIVTRLGAHLRRVLV